MVGRGRRPTCPATGSRPRRCSTRGRSRTPGGAVPPPGWSILLEVEGAGDYLPALRRQPRHHDRGRGPGRRGHRPSRPESDEDDAGVERGCDDRAPRSGSPTRRCATAPTPLSPPVHRRAGRPRSSAGLDAAGVPVIEVSHGDGLGGSLVQLRLLRHRRARPARGRRRGRHAGQDRGAAPARASASPTTCARHGRPRGVQVARIATHCTEADIAEQHIAARQATSGMEAVGFLMMAHMTEPGRCSSRPG